MLGMKKRNRFIIRDKFFHFLLIAQQKLLLFFKRSLNFRTKAEQRQPSPTPTKALSIVLKSCFLAFKRCMLKAEKCFSCVTQLGKQLRALNVSAYNNPLQLSCFMIFVFIFTCFCFFIHAFVFNHGNLKRCLTNAAIPRIQRTTQNYKMKLKRVQDICIFLQLCYPETLGSNFIP